MNAGRPYLLPQIVFLALVAVVAMLAIWRLQGHRQEVAAWEREVAAHRRDLQRLAAIGLLVNRLNDHPADAAVLARLARLTGEAREASPALRDDLYVQALEQQSRLAATSGASPPAAQRRSLPLLWISAHQQAEQRLTDSVAAWPDRSRRLLYEALMAFVLLVVLAVSYLYVVNYLFARPLHELARTARAVTDGNLRVRARQAPGGAVGQLAGDFNAMVDILVASLWHEEKTVQELQRKTRELEAANRHKSHFLANVSHELKTPLNAITGFADILESGAHGDLSERQADYLHRIGAASAHLKVMIEDLIDLAKLDLGRLTVEPQATDAAALARESCQLLEDQVRRKRHELAVDLPADLPAVHADPKRLRQILVNLLSNAVKFTPAGGHLRLACRAAANTVEIAVADDGIGIDPADQERIFEDFVQLDSHLHRQHEGTGIGLALSRRLAELMGGQLRLTSEPGVGSTFTVSLPRHDPE